MPLTRYHDELVRLRGVAMADQGHQAQSLSRNQVSISSVQVRTEQAGPDLGLGDALHPGTQARIGQLERRLDAEEVATIPASVTGVIASIR